MSARRTATRSLGVLALAAPLAASLLAVTTGTASAATSFTSPSSGAVVTSGSNVTVTGTVPQCTVSPLATCPSVTLTITSPAGTKTTAGPKAESRQGASTLSAAVSTPATARNGAWTAQLSGDGSANLSFYTNFAPATPADFRAQAADGDTRNVSFSWTKGSEADLVDYVLYEGSSPVDADAGQIDAASHCSGSTCYYAHYYSSDSPGQHDYQLVARRSGGGCASCGSTLESPNRASTSVTLVPPPPKPSPTPSATPDGGTTTGGSTTGGSSTGGTSTGGTTTGAGSSSGGSTTGGSSSGGSSTGGSATGSGGTVKSGPKPTLPALADPIVASRRAFALRFNAFSPSLGIPKLPPLPAISLPTVSGEGPLPQGTFKPQLPYQAQTKVEKTTSFTSRPIAAVRDVLDSDRLAKSLAGALILLLVGAHLRRYLGSHVEE